MKPTADQLEFATTSLLVALSARSLETGDHCPRVSRLALKLGRALRLSNEDLYALKFGSLLHDLGKIKVPDAVLGKPGRLTEAEWKTIHLHPIDGANMLRALDFPEAVCLIVEQHHETWSGGGYPFQLRAEEISIGARIFAVADTYDAITRDRCYRQGAPHSVAAHEIQSWAGVQFDPAVVETFLALPRPEPPVVPPALERRRSALL